MRRFQALLIVAGLAAAPVGAAAGPSHEHPSPQVTFEKFEWSTSKGRLGVMVMSLTPELRKYFNAAEDRGVLVAHVEPGSPAAAAGLTAGDVITEVQGKPIDRAGDVIAALADRNKGQTVPVQLVRNKKPMSVQVKLTNDPEPDPFAMKSPDLQWLREWMKPFSWLTPETRS